jgi:hypothetical protein
MLWMVSQKRKSCETIYNSKFIKLIFKKMLKMHKYLLMHKYLICNYENIYFKTQSYICNHIHVCTTINRHMRMRLVPRSGGRGFDLNGDHCAFQKLLDSSLHTYIHIFKIHTHMNKYIKIHTHMHELILIR